MTNKEDKHTTSKDVAKEEWDSNNTLKEDVDMKISEEQQDHEHVVKNQQNQNYLKLKIFFANYNSLKRV